MMRCRSAGDGGNVAAPTVVGWHARCSVRRAVTNAEILGEFVWIAVGVGYAASVWKLGRISRDPAPEDESERARTIHIVPRGSRASRADVPAEIQRDAGGSRR